MLVQPLLAPHCVCPDGYTGINCETGRLPVSMSSSARRERLTGQLNIRCIVSLNCNVWWLELGLCSSSVYMFMSIFLHVENSFTTIILHYPLIQVTVVLFYRLRQQVTVVLLQHFRQQAMVVLLHHLNQAVLGVLLHHLQQQVFGVLLHHPQQQLMVVLLHHFWQQFKQIQ